MNMKNNLNMDIKKKVTATLRNMAENKAEQNSVLSETSRRQKAQRAINNIGSRVKTYAILTSENPMGNRFSKSDNSQLIDRLKSYLKDGNFVWFPVKGMYGEKENPFIVYNISLTDALDIDKKFNQESIIWCDNESGEKQYWEQNGDGKFSKTHVRNYIDDMTDAEDYYTQVNRNFKFQIPFFNGKDDEMLNEMISEHNAIIDRVVRRNLKRINGDDNYYNRKVNDMLSSTKTGRSKWEARGSLYAGFSPDNLYAYPLLKEVYDSCGNNTKPISINETTNDYREPLLEMARIGYINGQFEVYVHTDDDGHIPHVHIRDKATRGQQFETCVELKRSRYSLHGKYKDVMSGYMAKQFADFMESTPHNPRYQNNYELSVDMWNLNNSIEEVVPQYDSNGRIIMPDYRTIMPNK